VNRRIEAFEAYSAHPLNKKLYFRLTDEERNLCLKFMEDHAALDLYQFADKTNRWYLGAPNKPKNLTHMWALLIQANVAAQGGK